MSFCHLFLPSIVHLLQCHWILRGILMSWDVMTLIKSIHFLSCLCLFLLRFDPLQLSSCFVSPSLSSPLYLFPSVRSFQGRWKNWKLSGSLAFATTRRMRLWAASWTSTTWQASSICWGQPWLSASSPSSVNICSIGSSGIVSWVSVLASLAWSSPSAE